MARIERDIFRFLLVGSGVFCVFFVAAILFANNSCLFLLTCGIAAYGAAKFLTKKGDHNAEN